MAKKLRSWRVLSCTLAVLATIVFIVACGEGQPVDIGTSDIYQAIQHAETTFNGHMPGITSQIRERSSSSSKEEPSSSSSEKDDNGNNSSSSSNESSKSSSSAASQNASSSSSEAKSSSSPYTLTCSVIKSTIDPKPTGYSASEIATIVQIVCKDKGVTQNVDAKDDVKWEADNPEGKSLNLGSSVVSGVYSNIKITMYDDAPCPYMKATCDPGKITVSGSTTPSSSSQSNSTQSSSSRASTGSSSSTPSSSSSPPPSSSSAASSGTCGSTGTMCLWDAAGGCWAIKDQAERENCAKNGWIFNGGEEGAGTACKGGTFICGKDNNPPKGGATSLGCCRWDDGKNQCWNIYTDTDVTNCKSGNNKFWEQKCPDTNGTCP